MQLASTPKVFAHTRTILVRRVFAALETYLSTSIDDALQSGNTIIKALALKQSFDLLGFS
jgi:hypothetical protein